MTLLMTGLFIDRQIKIKIKMRKIKITESILKKIIAESAMKVMEMATNEPSDETQAKIKEMEAKGYPADGSEYWPDNVIPVKVTAYCKLKPIQKKVQSGDYNPYDDPYDDDYDEWTETELVVDETAPITICCYQGNSPAKIKYEEVYNPFGFGSHYKFGCVGYFENVEFDKEPFFEKQIPYYAFFNNKANKRFMPDLSCKRSFDESQTPKGFKLVGQCEYLIKDDRIEEEKGTYFRIEVSDNKTYEICDYDPRFDGNDFVKTLDEYLK